MRPDYGYDSYRGKSGFRTFLICVIVLLLAVLAAAVAAFVFLQEYLVYGDDGQVRIELPFQREDPKSSDAPGEELIIVTAAPGPAESAATAGSEEPAGSAAVPSASLPLGAVPPAEETPEETPLPFPPAENTLQAVMLSEDELTGAAPGGEQLAGCNAVVLNMKDDRGKLQYVSQSSRAKGLNTSSTVSGRNDAIAAVTGGEIYTIARVSCFRDYQAPRQNNGLALRSTQGNWVDPEDMRWLNPAVEDARSYLVEVCTELAGMGFDELLLDNAFYPFEGKTGMILKNKNYDPENLNVPIEAFYQEIRAACPAIRLSIVAAPQGLADKASNLTGQSAELLARYADRVYVRTGSLEELQQAESLLTGAGLAPEQIICWHPAGEDSLSAGGGEAVWLP